MRATCTSGSTRGRRAEDLIRYSSSYSTGHSFFGYRNCLPVRRPPGPSEALFRSLLELQLH